MASGDFTKRNEADIVRCMSSDRCFLHGQCHSMCPMTNNLIWDKGYFTPGNLVALIYGWADGKLDTDTYGVPEKVFTCATCNQCRIECKEGVDIANLVIDARSELVKLGKIPQPINEILTNITETGNIYGKGIDERRSWIEKLPFKLDEKETADIVFYVGCVPLFSPKALSTTKAMVSLLDKLRLNWTTLGEEEICCGSPYHVGGMHDKIKEAATRITRMVEEKKAKTLLTTCPGCYYTFRVLYPRILGEKPNFDVRHTTQLFSAMLESGDLRLGLENTRATYHDPCKIGRWRGIYESPRKLIRNMFGENFVEVSHNRDSSVCCGGGGLLKRANRELSMKLAKAKIKEVLNDTGAKILVSACPLCEVNLKEAVEELGVDLQVQDIVELLDRNLLAQPRNEHTSCCILPALDVPVRKSGQTDQSPQ